MSLVPAVLLQPEYVSGYPVAYIVGTAYTLTADDVGKWLVTANAAPVTVTIPPQGADPNDFAAWSALYVQMGGTGPVTIAAGPGVTIHSSYPLTLTQQYSRVELKRWGLNEWVAIIVGDEDVGAATFTELTDVPGSYLGAAGLFVRVRGDESGLDFDVLVAADISDASPDGQDLITAADYSAMKLLLGYTAVEVASTPFGDVAAVTVQGAINELAAEKVGTTGNWFMSGSLLMTLNGTAVIINRENAGANPPSITFQKARGSTGAPATVSFNDTVGQFVSQAYGASAYVATADFFFTIIEPTPTNAAMGSQYSVRLCPVGSIVRTTALRVDWSAGVFALGGVVIDQNRVGRQRAYGRDWQTNSPVSGFSLTISDYVGALYLTPAGLLATGTLTMPANPIEGQEITIKSSQTITALTHNGNVGQTIDAPLTTIAALGFARYMYRGSSPTAGIWLRTG